MLHGSFVSYETKAFGECALARKENAARKRPRSARSVHEVHTILAGVVGIEPTSKVLETFILPMNYTPITS